MSHSAKFFVSFKNLGNSARESTNAMSPKVLPFGVLTSRKLRYRTPLQSGFKPFSVALAASVTTFIAGMPSAPALGQQFIQQPVAQNFNLRANAQLQGTGASQVVYDLGPAPVIPAANNTARVQVPSQGATPGFVMTPSGQMVRYQPGMQPAGFMVNGRMVQGGNTGVNTANLGQPLPPGVGGNFWTNPGTQRVTQPRVQFVQPPAPQPAPPPRPQPMTPTTVYQSPLFQSNITNVGQGLGVQTRILAPASVKATDVSNLALQAGQQELTRSAQRFNQSASVRPEIISSEVIGAPAYQGPATLPAPAFQPPQPAIIPQGIATTTITSNTIGTAPISNVPAGQVQISSDVQAEAPIIPPAAEPAPAPTNDIVVSTPQPLTDPNDPELFQDLTLSSFDGSLVPDIPEIGDIGALDDEIEDIAVTNDNGLGKWSSGIAFNINGLGSEIANDFGALSNSVGISLDTGRRLNDTLVGRVKLSVDTLDVAQADMPIAYRDTTSGGNIEGTTASLHALADWHPFENGFRVSAGPGITFMDVEDTTKAFSADQTVLSPYIGLGYDASLFRPSRWGVWGDIGTSFLVGADDFATSSLGTVPDINIGIKRRW